MPHSSGLRNSFPQLIKQLASDGARVAESELALARAEIGGVLRDYMLGMAIAAASLAALIVATGLLAHSAALALMPYVGSAALAYLSAGLILTLISFALSIVAKRAIFRKRTPVSLICKWFSDVTKTH